MNLRHFLLEVMRKVLKDCSFKHPAFQSGHVEVAISKLGTSASFMAPFESQRVRRFNSSAEVAIALLASSTLGISGLPFSWRSPEDEEATLVADGAFTDFMP